MTLQQPGTGYRDPAKAMTIKALQERQKQAADIAAKATAIPEGPMSSMWQGASHLSGILSGQVQQNRADANEADARQRLTELIAGVDPTTGPTQQQYAEMRMLDPDMADRQYEAAMKERWADENRRDEQGFTKSEREAAQGFTAGQQHELFGQQDKSAEELAREADRARQDAARIAEGAAISADTRTDQNTIDENNLAVTEKKRQEAAAADEKMRQEAAETDIGPETAAREAEWKRLNPTGDINSPEAQSYILRDAAAPTDSFGGPAGLKAVQEWQQEGNLYTTALNDVNEAKALVPQALTGDIGRKVAEAASSLGETGINSVAALSSIGSMVGMPGITREQIQATVRLYQIMDNIATTRMSNTLKGQSSNLEMEKFTRIFANPGATPEAKLQALISLEQAFTMDRNTISSTIQASGGQALSPYEYKPLVGGMTTDPAAPELSDEDLLKKYR